MKEKKIAVGAMVCLVVLALVITIVVLVVKQGNTTTTTPGTPTTDDITSIAIPNEVQKIDRTVSDDFSYEHCSFWIDDKEEKVFSFIGTDDIKFYSVSNTDSNSTTGKDYLNNGYEYNRGIAVIVEGKYIVVISNEEYRGSYWHTEKKDGNKNRYLLTDTNGLEIYALSSGKYQLIKEIDGEKVCFYTSIDKIAKDISDLEARKEKVYQILSAVSNTIVKYDKTSFAIDKVAKDEFDRFNLKVNSYKNITYYCNEENSNYNARIQIDEYIFKVLFKSVKENQKFNYKLTDYSIGKNTIGYYSSGSHTNITIQNLENNIYKNDYLVVTTISTPNTEERNVLEYAPEMLNKVFTSIV